MTEMPINPNVIPPQVGPSGLENILRKQTARLDRIDARSAQIGIAAAGNFANYGGGFTACTYTQVNGEVVLRGLWIVITTGYTAGASAFAVGAGFKPAGQELFMVETAAGPVRIDVQADGNIIMPQNNLTVGTWGSLAGIRYFADH